MQVPTCTVVKYVMVSKSRSLNIFSQAKVKSEFFNHNFLLG